MKVDSAREWQRLRRRRRWAITLIVLLVVGVVAAIAAIAVLVLRNPSNPVNLTPKRTVSQKLSDPVSPLNLPPPDLLRPITPEQALQENAERPFSGRPDSPAAAFALKTDETSRERALECLTQAVYYEAASEGADGERAVAQVVLNRMRHPAYPSTVCGVVYQGSDRPTGCQFTFTCNGSLARLPVPSLWKQAQKVASQALAGKVFAPVGHATHYHADYVLPYWADSLDKSVQIGRHIFYRLKGGLGSSGAFAQRYGGKEPMPPPPASVDVALEAVQNADTPLDAPLIDPNLQAPTGEMVSAAKPKPQLAADLAQGTLILDAGAAPTTSAEPRARVKKEESCDNAAGSNRLKPISANDNRSESAKSAC